MKSSTVWIALAGAALHAAAAAEVTMPHIERLDLRLDALLAPDARIEVVAGGIAWAEGPVWSARDGALLFSDVPRNGVYRLAPGKGVSLYLPNSGYEGVTPFTGKEPGSNGLAFDARGRLVLCQHGNRRIARREQNGRISVLADRYEGRRFNSPNDLVFRSNGDLFFTDPPFGLPDAFADAAKELPHQGVYRLQPRGGLTLVLTALEAPNGLAFSPDERSLYVSNASAAHPVWMKYPVRRDGSLGEGREFAHARDYVRDGDGLPDGLKVDVHGNVFAAGPGGVHVFTPDGSRLGRIVTGVPTGNVAWGEDGSVLYIAANHEILRVQTRTRGKIG